jgi:ATP-dependent RNA helicase RhlE
MDQSEEYHVRQIEKLIRQKIELTKVPEGVVIEETPKTEFIDQMREIDRQKRKENPDFKGAFHEKKHKPSAKNKKTPTASKSKKFKKR